MRVVFDANIFVSAFAIPGGQADEALKRAIDGTDRLIISKNILDEVLTVLARKFSRDAEAISRTALFISDISETVKPERTLGLLRDSGDNRVLECAIAGKADAVVTGDKEMLGLREFEGVSIVSLKNYLK